MRAKEILKERSAEFAEISPEGSERDQHWAVFEKAFTTAKMWYDKTDRKWLMGNTFSYADVITATNLLWFKRPLYDVSGRR